jgi:hypothetical protein
MSDHTLNFVESVGEHAISSIIGASAGALISTCAVGAAAAHAGDGGAVQAVAAAAAAAGGGGGALGVVVTGIALALDSVGGSIIRKPISSVIGGVTGLVAAGYLEARLPPEAFAAPERTCPALEQPAPSHPIPQGSTGYKSPRGVYVNIPKGFNI